MSSAAGATTPRRRRGGPGPRLPGGCCGPAGPGPAMAAACPGSSAGSPSIGVESAPRPPGQVPLHTLGHQYMAGSTYGPRSPDPQLPDASACPPPGWLPGQAPGRTAPRPRTAQALPPLPFRRRTCRPRACASETRQHSLAPRPAAPTAGRGPSLAEPVSRGAASALGSGRPSTPLFPRRRVRRSRHRAPQGGAATRPAPGSFSVGAEGEPTSSCPPRQVLGREAARGASGRTPSVKQAREPTSSERLLSSRRTRLVAGAHVACALAPCGAIIS